jgi:hypothetical protein
MENRGSRKPKTNVMMIQLLRCSPKGLSNYLNTIYLLDTEIWDRRTEMQQASTKSTN